MGTRAWSMPLILAASALVVALAASAASAKTYRVTRHDDPRPRACKHEDCSLREAIRAANKHRGRDVVVLPDRAPRYRLSRHEGGGGNNRGDLDVAGPITIRHGLGGRAVIDARGVSRVLDIHRGAATKLARVTLTGGDVSAAGGGVATHAPLRLIRSVLLANRADSGGGILATAPLTLMRTRVRDNEATRGVGGGIDARLGLVRIIRSKVTGNRGSAGGGIALGDDVFRLSKSTVAHNSSDAEAGGVYLLRAVGRIAESTINGNVAHGSGGGLYQSESSLAVFNATITRNRADLTGGGIQSAAAGGNVMLNSVTVVHNVANGSGRHALGGGLASKGGTFGVANSIVALNRSGATPNDCHGAFHSFEGNLVGTLDYCRGFAGPAMVGLDPKLGSLADNGGPTKTLALSPGSPAIGRADTAREPELDQRGRKRGARPDIGAFERSP